MSITGPWQWLTKGAVPSEAMNTVSQAKVTCWGHEHAGWPGKL